jgi:hypothetical protein
VGRRRPGLACAAAVVAVAIAAPAPSDAAVTLGPNPLPQRSSVVSSAGARIFANLAVPGATLAAPADGIITRWRVRRGSGPGIPFADTVTLRVLRPTGVSKQFVAAGTSEPHMVPTGDDPVDVYEYPTRLPIRAGDTIGLGTTIGEFTALNQTNAAYLTRTNALDDGDTATFTAGAFPDKAVLVNADVEPDANCDGLGDESQEPVVSGGCLPPKAASLGATAAKVARGVVSIPLTCAPAGGNCDANQVSLTARAHKAHKARAAKQVTLGAVSFSIPAGQSQSIAVTLSKRARKLLKGSKKLKSTATITGGGATAATRFTLKR